MGEAHPACQGRTGFPKSMGDELALIPTVSPTSTELS